MHELASLLEPMDFSLKKSKGTVHLIGKEMRIRFFMVAFFWRVFSGLHWPLRVYLKENVKRSSRKSTMNVRFLLTQSN